MKGVLLAGGRGTRLQPLTDHIPKPLLPIAGKPCLEYLIGSFTRAGIRDIILTTSYKADFLMDALGGGDQFDGRFLYGLEETPAGTAGAIKRVVQYLDDTFVVANGDLMLDIDIGELVRFHKEKGAKVTISLHEVEDPSPFGVVALDEDDRVVRFQEKPTREEAFSNLINAGIYVIERDVFELVPDDTKFDFSRNLFPIVLEKGLPMYGVKLTGDWIDVGRRRDLLLASQTMAEKYGEKTSSASVINDSEIELNTLNLSGPCYIGKDSMISGSARIESSMVGSKTKIGDGVVLEGSIVYDGAVIGENAHLVNSIICPGIVVPAGTKVTEKIVG